MDCCLFEKGHRSAVVVVVGMTTSSIDNHNEDDVDVEEERKRSANEANKDRQDCLMVFFCDG